MKTLDIIEFLRIIDKRLTIDFGLGGVSIRLIDHVDENKVLNEKFFYNCNQTLTTPHLLLTGLIGDFFKKSCNKELDRLKLVCENISCNIKEKQKDMDEALEKKKEMERYFFSFGDLK